jgi:hypothetical protein
MVNHSHSQAVSWVVLQVFGSLGRSGKGGVSVQTCDALFLASVKGTEEPKKRALTGRVAEIVVGEEGRAGSLVKTCTNIFFFGGSCGIKTY